MNRVLIALFLVALISVQYVAQATEVGDKAKDAAETAETKFNEGKQAAADAKDSLGERISKGYEEGKAAASGAKDKIGEKVEEAGKKIQD
ncbi:unnamed protein product, partial [Mesorhabditis spiculigera]